MKLSASEAWERFRNYYFEFPTLGLSMDLSRMNLSKEFLQRMEPAVQRAFAAMDELERGAIANPDERRMVGHYWLRNPSLAPTEDLRREITDTLTAIKAFAADVHSGKVAGAQGKFTNVLVIGIGGSALGPELVASALGHPKTDRMQVHFFDNTDPDGMDRVLAKLESELGKTLCVVISKSGGTKETRNGMLEAGATYARAGLKFAPHAVAITGHGSELDRLAEREGWIRRFPMWDWVGGRTSETSAVGLLPAALQGIDIDQFLKGAGACDGVTRSKSFATNPSAQLALMWHLAGDGKGLKDMVIIPYKDRLELFSRYLQQLVMESLGKELDLAGHTVHQGIAVYGNKGSTDQHAYVQQLRDGLNNFFVTLIRVLKDREGASMRVDPGVTSGDYLHGFLLGTRKALAEKDRESLTITIDQVSPFTVGVLIALYERAVGFYASFVNINAYHQPGVEAGKKAAGDLLGIQRRIQEYLDQHHGKGFTVEELAKAIAVEDVESVFLLAQHLAHSDRPIRLEPGRSPWDARFGHR